MEDRRVARVQVVEAAGGVEGHLGPQPLRQLRLLLLLLLAVVRVRVRPVQQLEQRPALRQRRHDAQARRLGARAQEGHDVWVRQPAHQRDLGAELADALRRELLVDQALYGHFRAAPRAAVDLSEGAEADARADGELRGVDLEGVVVDGGGDDAGRDDGFDAVVVSVSSVVVVVAAVV